jgi:type IV secretion system protein VirB4
LNVVSESIHLPDAYKTILPAGRESSVRDLEINATQFGATTHIYKASEGQFTVEDLQGEEAQYIFQSADGSPFHFSPFTGGRGVVIGVGPIRSGKSFTKNTLASHFVKYGGFYRAIDIDPGSETLAQFFGADGAVFRIGQGGNGFNPFFAAKGPNDLPFISHLKNTVMEMLKKNENEKMRTVEMFEQQQLDRAIVATLRLPKHLQRFSAMVNHCPAEFQQKLSRWTADGMHADLFDRKTDAVGSLDKPVVAFNLAGVKDDPVRFPLTMAEVFYRVTRMFEDPDYRNVPKYLDIDEAHAL